MELRHIRYFLAVADEENMTRAAANLGINQPPLSQQIKDLEREVGAALFHRIPQGVELTEAGEVFYQAVKDLPTTAQHALHMSQRAAKGLSGSLHLGFTGTAALNPKIPATIKAFQAAYPEVELVIKEATALKLVGLLLQEKLDIAIILPSSSDDPSLYIREIIEEELIAVLPIDHPLAATAENEAISLQELAASPFIMTAREDAISLHDAVLENCRAAGFEPKLGPAAPQIASILSLVAANLGVSLLPDSMRQLSIAGVTFRSIAAPTPKVSLALAYRQRHPSPTTLNFASILREFSSD